MVAARARVAIVIPVCCAATRLPGKPMVQRVYEWAQAISGIDIIVVATDDIRIVKLVHAFGGKAIMIAAEHPSSVDRLKEVMQTVLADIYISIPGGEPLLRPSDIERLIQGMLTDQNVRVGTFCQAIGAIEANDPNTVKTVLADNGDALYFSRAPIPYHREDDTTARYLKHIDVYAYRHEVLSHCRKLPQSMIERTEQLEQLRLIAAGIRMRTFRIAAVGQETDTPQHLECVRADTLDVSDVVTPVLSAIRLVITDVDGVLTTGHLHYTADGEAIKTFHARDGLGMRLLEASGVRVAVLSGRSSAALRKRVKDLGVTLTAFGVKDKYEACLQLMEQAGVSPAQTACIGDDSIDLPAFAACGLSFAVSDAPDYIKEQASHTLRTAGGYGAFRELADDILDAQGKGAVFREASGYQAVMTAMRQ